MPAEDGGLEAAPSAIAEKAGHAGRSL